MKSTKDFPTIEELTQLAALGGALSQAVMVGDREGAMALAELQFKTSLDVLAGLMPDGFERWVRAYFGAARDLQAQHAPPPTQPGN